MLLSICCRTNALNVDKKCIDCKFYIQERYPYQNSVYGKCLLFKREKNHLIFDGKAVLPSNTRFHYASTAREREFMCGFSGRSFINDLTKSKNVGKILDM
jgi:hypothetical protein